MQKIKDLSALHPNVQRLFHDFLSEIREKTGQDIRVAESYRRKDLQDYYYQQGGKTGAKFPYSFHNWGLAIDIYRNDAGRTSYNIDWETCSKIAEKYGITWGGDWNGNGIKEKGEWDNVHFEYSGGYTIQQIVDNPSVLESFWINYPKKQNISLAVFNPPHENQYDNEDTAWLCFTYSLTRSLYNRFKQKGYSIDIDELEVQKQANTWLERIFNIRRPLQAQRLLDVYRERPFPYMRKNIYLNFCPTIYKPSATETARILHECLLDGIVPIVGIGGNSKYKHEGDYTIYSYSQVYHTSFHAVTIDTYKDGEFSGQNSGFTKRHRITDLRCINTIHIPLFGEEIIEIYNDVVRWKSQYKDDFVSYTHDSLPMRRIKKYNLVAIRKNKNFKD